jgi:membrane associated rhomboid family serine protease
MSKVDRLGDLFSFGGRVPPALGLLLALTGVASLLGAVGAQTGLPLFDLSVLQPGLVWRGEVWRLLTWVLVEASPLNLIFALLMLYWFGRDLCFALGPRRFLLVYAGAALAMGAATTLLARVWPALLGTPYFGLWAVMDVLIVAWALIFPKRQMLFWFVLPMTGQILLYITLGGTLLFALYHGLRAFVPHICGELMMIAYIRGISLRRIWQRYRLWTFERRARRARRLKIIKGNDGSPPTWLN